MERRSKGKGYKKGGAPMFGMGMLGSIFGRRKGRFSKMHDKLHDSMSKDEKPKTLKPVDPRDTAPPATPPKPPGKPVENKKEE